MPRCRDRDNRCCRRGGFQTLPYGFWAPTSQPLSTRTPVVIRAAPDLPRLPALVVRDTRMAGSRLCPGNPLKGSRAVRWIQSLVSQPPVSYSPHSGGSDQSGPCRASAPRLLRPAKKPLSSRGRGLPALPEPRGRYPFMAALCTPQNNPLRPAASPEGEASISPKPATACWQAKGVVLPPSGEGWGGGCGRCKARHVVVARPTHTPGATPPACGRSHSKGPGLRPAPPHEKRIKPLPARPPRPQGPCPSRRRGSGSWPGRWPGCPRR